MDGVLLVDKPAGPTSHDVVARLRKTSGERSIGHTGTLDPRATGLLPLVLGKATRLASFLSGGDKTYEATIQLGLATDTDDADGQPLSDRLRAAPEADVVTATLATFMGEFEQIPPRHSAKKIGGERAYELARRAEPVTLKPVLVTVRALECLAHRDDQVDVRVTASSGFYVRALARDLGDRLGCGAHLLALRRTGSAPFDVTSAVTLEEAERLGRDVVGRLLSPAEALPHLPVVTLTPVGLVRARHGNPLGPEHLSQHWLPPASHGGPVRVLDAEGRLVALAHSRGGALHPAVVLG